VNALVRKAWVAKLHEIRDMVYGIEQTVDKDAMYRKVEDLLVAIDSYKSKRINLDDITTRSYLSTIINFDDLSPNQQLAYVLTVMVEDAKKHLALMHTATAFAERAVDAKKWWVQWMEDTHLEEQWATQADR